MTAPSPDPVALLIAAVVVLAVLYVCVFEIGVPTFRHWMHLRRTRRYGGYLYERDNDRVGM